MVFYCFVIISIINFVRASKLSCTQIEGIFPHGNSSYSGRIVGFGDVNGDGFTDVFYLNNFGTELRVMLMAHGHVHFDYALFYVSQHFSHHFGKIRSVILGDFSGQSHLDVVILAGHPHGPYTAFYRGNIGNFSFSARPTELEVKHIFAIFKQLPLLFYYDDDNLPDLLAIHSKGHQWKVWQYGSKKWNLPIALPNLNVSYAAKKPIYSLFFDTGTDYSSEVMLTDYAERKFKFYGWSSTSGTINFSELKREISFPPSARHIAPPIKADWCLNGTAGLLLAYCDHISCYGKTLKLAIFNLKRGSNWIEYEIPNLHWVSSGHTGLNLATPPPISPLRIVDVNLDAYPDIIATVRNKTSNKEFLGALINKCNRGILNFSFAEIQTNITSAIPFDFMEDGKLDIFSNDMGIIKLHKINFEQINSGNVNFLKVSVLPGHCIKGTCPVPVVSRNNNHSYSLPYGIPNAGVSLSLEVKDESGAVISMRGYLGSDTSYLALQLPYYLFSLSENMRVSSLTVGLFKGYPSLRSFDAITSKVHAVINPVDINDPDKWSVEVISTIFHKKSNFIGILYVFLCFIVIGFTLLLVMLSFRREKQPKKIPEDQAGELMSSME